MKNFVFNPSDVSSLFLLRTESIEYTPQALRVHSLEFIKYCAMFASDFFLKERSRMFLIDDSSSAASAPFPEEATVVGLVSFLSWGMRLFDG